MEEIFSLEYYRRSLLDPDVYIETWYGLPLVAGLAILLAYMVWRATNPPPWRGFFPIAMAGGTIVFSVLAVWSGFWDGMLYAAWHFEWPYTLLGFYGAGFDRLLAWIVWLMVPRWRPRLQRYWLVSIGVAPFVNAWAAVSL